MNKYIPLLGLALAAFYMFRVSNELSKTADAIAPGANDVAIANKPDAPPAPAPKAAPARADSVRDEPAYKSVIRCLNDVDDILDTITNQATFAAAKPKLLNRVRQQAALAAQHSNQGMTQMSRAASKEMQKAVNRHTASVMRADSAVRGVVAFFEKDVAAAMNQK
jgi:hypothetical protein